MLQPYRGMARTVVRGGRGEEGPLCDPGSKLLLLGGSENVVRAK